MFKDRGIDVVKLPLPEVFMRLSRSRPVLSAFLFLLSLPGLIAYFFKFARVLRQRRPDIVHTTGLKCHLIAALFARLLKTKVVWHLRDILGSSVLQKTFVAAARFGRVEVVANSQATANSLPLKEGRPIAIVYNGFDSAAFAQPRATHFHDLLKLSPETKLIALLGVLAQWKGQREFVAMANQLKQTDVHFLIIGDSIYDTAGDREYKQELIDLIAQLKVGDRVHMIGYIADAAKNLSELDILVHASLRPEPFGRVIVEAMASRVPVVAAGAGGVLEIIENEINGLLFSPGDVADMSRQVARILRDADFAQRLRTNAYADFTRRFSIEGHVQGVLKVYEALYPSSEKSLESQQ